MKAHFDITVSKVLQAVGRNVPLAFPFRAIPNRILWPIHKTLHLPGGISESLGFKMLLDPNECVDRNLWFAPQNYDRDEIKIALSMARKISSFNFMDIGANVGFWSLRIATEIHHSNVCAIEANPMTFEILQENFRLNNLSKIKAFNAAVTNRVGEVNLFLNTTGNRGGDSCEYRKDRKAITVPALRITDVVNLLAWDKIDLLKIDIEGHEEIALSNLFETKNRTIWPNFICAETNAGSSLSSLLTHYNYSAIRRFRENTFFEKR